MINRYQVIGIGIIAVGSLTVLYFQKILGTITIAIGTFVLTYGGAILSKKQGDITLSEIDERLGDFEQKLANAHNILATAEREKTITKIKNEYIEWARNFTSKKHEIELAQKRKEIAEEEHILNESKKVRPYYKFFIDTLCSFLEAHNASHPPKIIKFDTIRKLDSKFFISDSEQSNRANSPYEAIVEFNKDTKWRIFIANHPHYVQFVGGPQLNVSQIPHNTEVKNIDEHKFIFGIVFNSDKELILVKSNVAYLTKTLKETYSLKDYETQVINIVKVLLEFQLSLVE